MATQQEKKTKPTLKEQLREAAIFLGIIIAVVAGFIVWANNGGGSSSNEWRTQRDMEERIAVAQVSIKEILKDGDSAKFKGLFVRNGNVCGEVNAKNSFGAYTGYQRFVAVGSVRVHFSGQPGFADLWRQHCQ